MTPVHRLAVLALPMTAAVLLAAPRPAPAQAAPADLGALATRTLEVRELAAPLPEEPASPLWDGLPVLEIPVAAQVTIRLNDAKANEAAARAAAGPVRVRAATDGKSLAVLLEWPDATESRPPAGSVDAYGDAVALQIPRRSGPGVRLPYVGMGDEAEPVELHLLRATAAGSTPRQAVATGFGSSARAELGGLRGGMRYDAARRAWRAALVLALGAGGLDPAKGLVPFAVAVWDGDAKERGGNKALGGWRFLRLPRQPVDRAWIADLSWGLAPGSLGDPAKGRETFEGTCTPCHSAGASRAAPGLAPDLSAIGVIATPAYLRDSIVQPSQVIVPNPNPAQHQDRTKAPAPDGAWPVDEGYVWYVVGSDGKRSSSMPDYATMPADEVSALVAYLMTLGAVPPGAGSKP